MTTTREPITTSVKPKMTVGIMRPMEGEFNAGVRAFRGLTFATALSIPVWAGVGLAAYLLSRMFTG